MTREEAIEKHRIIRDVLPFSIIQIKEADFPRHHFYLEVSH
jgi:hypothetical protein